MKQRDEYDVECKVHNPRAVNLVCDATFYGKRQDKLDTLVFKDVATKEILIWKHIESEIVKDYRYLKEELIRLGYTITGSFTRTKKNSFKANSNYREKLYSKLDDWHELYKDFLEEKSVSSTTGELHYTHPRIRAAYRSLRTNLSYLFTYKNHKELHIQNTTNALEGGVFSHMKNMISLHRGLSKSLKLNLVDYYLVSYRKK